VHGGQSPVLGAQVLVYQVGSSGYGMGNRALACTSTDAHGHFSFGSASPICPGFPGLSSSLNCPVAGSPDIYLLAQGGNPGAGANAALLMMAALGNCNTLPAGFSVIINEVTTVAAAWSLSQFMNCSGGSVDGAIKGCGSNSRDVGASANNALGLANELLVSANLADTSSGSARSSSAATTTPAAEINTLADILQDCVNSTGATSTACHNLFSCVVPGAVPGAGNVAPCVDPIGAVVPADTLTAALDIARNPGNDVATLFNLTSKAPAFTPVLSAAPTDWTIALGYQGGGLSGPVFVAIDELGNAWFANATGRSVTEITPSGAFPLGSGFVVPGALAPLAIAIMPNSIPLAIWVADAGGSQLIVISPPLPFSSSLNGNGISHPMGLAIDGNGSIWSTNVGTNAVVEWNLTGFISPTSGCPGTTNCGYTAGAIKQPSQIAIDSGGNAWVANFGTSTVVELNTSGVPLTGPAGLGGGGLKSPFGIAIDGANNAWVTNSLSGVVEINSAGFFLSGPSGFTGIGLAATSVATDSAGNAWIANFGNSLTEINSAGLFVAGPRGYTSSTLMAPSGVAIDGSGNIWLGSSNNFRTR
jgi:hypothetical protein